MSDWKKALGTALVVIIVMAIVARVKPAKDIIWPS